MKRSTTRERKQLEELMKFANKKTRDAITRALKGRR
jgi:hypothetical protein